MSAAPRLSPPPAPPSSGVTALLPRLAFSAADLLTELAHTYDGMERIERWAKGGNIVLTGPAIARELRWLGSFSPAATPAWALLVGYRIAGQIAVDERAEMALCLYGTGRALASAVEREVGGEVDEAYARWRACYLSSKEPAPAAPLLEPVQLWGTWGNRCAALARWHEGEARKLAQDEMGARHRRAATSVRGLEEILRREILALQRAW